MFLIRIAFWVGLVVLLLPTDRHQQQRLYTAASEAAHRVATFCDRNAATCERGAEYWAVFKRKLEFGTKLVFDVASERLLGRETATEETSSSTHTPARGDRVNGTLLPSDLKPTWRLKPAKAGA